MNEWYEFFCFGVFSRIKIWSTEQENQQRVLMYGQILIQSYQCIIGTLLLLFVPQACGKDLDRACFFQEALQRDEKAHQIALALNFVTLFCFILLYVIEYIREECLIDYLDANPECTCTGKDVLRRLKQGMPRPALREIATKSHQYVLAFRLAVCAFLINTAVSGYVCLIYHPLPGLTTRTTFLTSVLYIVLKLASVFLTTHAAAGEYHSGYVRTRLQFNDVDRNYWASYKAESDACKLNATGAVREEEEDEEENGDEDEDEAYEATQLYTHPAVNAVVNVTDDKFTRAVDSSVASRAELGRGYGYGYGYGATDRFLLQQMEPISPPTPAAVSVERASASSSYLPSSVGYSSVPTAPLSPAQSRQIKIQRLGGLNKG